MSRNVPEVREIHPESTEGVSTMGRIRAGLVVLLAAMIGLWSIPAAAAKKQMSIRFFDVGQGDAAAIRLPDGDMILVDAGPSDRLGLPERLRAFGARESIRILISHPHSDHLGGYPAILKSFAIREATDTGYPHPSQMYEGILSALALKKTPYHVARRGQTRQSGTVTFRYVHPAPEDSPPDPNEASLVFLVQFGRFRALFTGDAGEWAESRIFERGGSLAADVLKVGHHGSRTSTSARFLAVVRPKAAIISVGSGNDYGHPHRETLARLNRAGVKVYRTDRHGDITVSTDGTRWWVETSRTGK